MANSEQKNSKVLQYIIFGIILTITLVVLIHYFFFLFGGSISPEGINTNFYMDNNITLEKKGVFGDFTSGHFTILAFIWLAYGIFIQSREFKLQRDEFENQTEQFKEQNKLYAQQMKELEIQSIQNQFDRKIIKLTEIEKIISSEHKDIYEYINLCSSDEDTWMPKRIKKINSVEKYIELYDNLNQFVEIHKKTIDLSGELMILKKDIYDGLKLSFLGFIRYVKRAKEQSWASYLNTTGQHRMEALKIYNQLWIRSSKEIYSYINELNMNRNLLDSIQIFEKQN